MKLIKNKFNNIFIISLLIILLTIFFTCFNYFLADSIFNQSNDIQEFIKNAEILQPNSDGLYEIDVTSLMKETNNESNKPMLFGYEEVKNNFILQSGRDTFPSGTSHVANYTFSNPRVNRKENKITYDVGCYYDVYFPDVNHQLQFHSDDFHVSYTDSNGLYHNDLIGVFSSNNGWLQANGLHDRQLIRTETFPVTFYANIDYTCAFEDSRDNNHLASAAVNLRFNNFNNAPTISPGSIQVINEGDVASGQFTSNSLYTGELGNGTSGTKGFIYYDPDTTPSGTNKFGTTDVAKNATISSIKNSKGTVVNLNTMNTPDTYTITSTTTDEYGLSASATRTVKVNAKPQLKGSNSTWIAGDTRATAESLITDTRSGNVNTNKTGSGGFLVYDKEEYPQWGNPYTVANSTSVKTSITEIKNTKTNQVVNFNTMNTTPGTYEVSARAYDNGNGSGRTLYSNVVKRTITVVGYNITTSVRNGTITPSKTNLLMNSSNKIDFSPNDGYVLESITVDGTKLNINNYKDADSYSFNNLNANHSISVSFRKASPVKLIINKSIVDKNNAIINKQNLNKYDRTVEDTISRLLITSSKSKYHLFSEIANPTNIYGLQKDKFKIGYIPSHDIELISLNIKTKDTGISISANNNNYKFDILNDSRIERTINIDIVEKLNNEVMGDSDRKENFIKIN